MATIDSTPPSMNYSSSIWTVQPDAAVRGRGTYSSYPAAPWVERAAHRQRLGLGARWLIARVWPIAIALRPKQWLKNGLLCLPFAFSVGQSWSVGDADSWLPLVARLMAAVIAFCAVASATYLVNDLYDMERDRLHPTKRWRPLAAATLRPPVAVGAIVLLVALGGIVGVSLGRPFGMALAAYLMLTVSYSSVLKQIVILDLLALSMGFVLRAVAGALAIAAPVSPWLYLCTLLGALFVAIAKRRHELLLLADGAAQHRPILGQYTSGLLGQMSGVAAASTIAAYALYTVSSEGMPRNHLMLATIPFVLYGLFRYMYLDQCQGAAGHPEDVFLRDRPLQLCGVLWVVGAMVILAFAR